jgi:hypothetical protein
MLSLRDVVRHLPALQKALAGSKSDLLRIMCNVRYEILTHSQHMKPITDAVGRTLGQGRTTAFGEFE